MIHVYFVRPEAPSISSWMRPLGFEHMQSDAVFDERGGVEFRSRGADISPLELPTGRRSALDPTVAAP